MMTYGQMQSRVADWATHNFGLNPPWRMVCGIAEEVGEFKAATTTAERLDALGDIAIYSMNLCADRGWQYADLWHRACHMVPNPMLDVSCYVGGLCRAVLKRDQGIRGYDQPEVFDTAIRDNLQVITWYTAHWYQSMSSMRGGDLNPSLAQHEQLVSGVVERVLSRDWHLHPNDAQLHEGVTS
jgi:hypothetical protein